MNNADYFATNECAERTHCFARDGANAIQAYHADDSLCESAEFRFAQMLNDEVEQIIECPWCLKRPVDEAHIRKCSNYKPRPTREEICDPRSQQ